MGHAFVVRTVRAVPLGASRFADWPLRDGSTKLREGQAAVKWPCGRPLSTATRVSTPALRRLFPPSAGASPARPNSSPDAFDAGDIPLPPPQHQPPTMQKIRWPRRPVVAVDLGVVDGHAALGDRAPCGPLAR